MWNKDVCKRQTYILRKMWVTEIKGIDFYSVDHLSLFFRFWRVFYLVKKRILSIDGNPRQTRKTNRVCHTSSSWSINLQPIRSISALERKLTDAVVAERDRSLSAIWKSLLTHHSDVQCKTDRIWAFLFLSDPYLWPTNSTRFSSLRKCTP